MRTSTGPRCGLPRLIRDATSAVALVLLVTLASPVQAQSASTDSRRPFEISDNSFLVEEALNQERGVFPLPDGGRNFERVLFKNENTATKNVDIDPSNHSIVYAALS